MICNKYAVKCSIARLLQIYGFEGTVNFFYTLKTRFHMKYNKIIMLRKSAPCLAQIFSE